tara:strand:- start:90 stop:611 length:522 start_codon:yes stop_codon:yes gene_type:complete
MIDLKSNLDRLEDRASDFYKRGQNDEAYSSDDSGDRQRNALQTASDLRGAVQDISNLRDYAERLERNIYKIDCELNTLKTGPVDLGDAINAAIKSYVESALVNNGQLDALEARIETVEGFKDDLEPDDIPGLESYIDDRIEEASCGNDRDDETRDTVRDMIRDGEIIVTVDVS